MTRQAAIARCKAAHRLWLTRGIKPTNMPMEVTNDMVIFWPHGWTIVLKLDGALLSCDKWEA